MRSALTRSNLVGSVIIESTEVMTAVHFLQRPDEKLLCSHLALQARVIGGLLGGATLRYRRLLHRLLLVRLLWESAVSA